MAAESAEFSALLWRKSRTSDTNGGCVEVAFQGRTVLVRDSHDKAGAILEVPSASWHEFITRIRAGSAVIP